MIKKNIYDGCFYEVYRHGETRTLFLTRKICSSLSKEIESFSYYRRKLSFTNPTAIELHKVKLLLAGNDL